MSEKHHHPKHHERTLKQWLTSHDVNPRAEDLVIFLVQQHDPKHLADWFTSVDLNFQSMLIDGGVQELIDLVRRHEGEVKQAA